MFSRKNYKFYHFYNNFSFITFEQNDGKISNTTFFNIFISNSFYFNKSKSLLSTAKHFQNIKAAIQLENCTDNRYQIAGPHSLKVNKILC